MKEENKGVMLSLRPSVREDRVTLCQMPLVGKNGENGLAVGLTTWRSLVPCKISSSGWWTKILSGVGQERRQVEELETEFRDNIFGGVLP